MAALMMSLAAFSIDAVLPALVNTHGMTGIYVDLMDRHIPVPNAATAEDLANLFVFLAFKTVRKCSGSWLVDNTLYFKASNFTSVFGCLTL